MTSEGLRKRSRFADRRCMCVRRVGVATVMPMPRVRERRAHQAPDADSPDRGSYGKHSRLPTALGSQSNHTHRYARRIETTASSPAGLRRLGTAFSDKKPTWNMVLACAPAELAWVLTLSKNELNLDMPVRWCVCYKVKRDTTKRVVVDDTGCESWMDTSGDDDSGWLGGEHQRHCEFEAGGRTWRIRGSK